MSWDAGAISNFGALNYPAAGGSGGGSTPIPNNLIVSTLVASDSVTSNVGNFSTITSSGSVTSNIGNFSTLTGLVDISGPIAHIGSVVADKFVLRGQTMPYVYGGFAATSTTGTQTVTLPFSYTDTNYQIVVNYGDIGARAAALADPGLMAIPATVSSFDLVSEFNAASFVVQYITCGALAAPI